MPQVLQPIEFESAVPGRTCDPTIHLRLEDEEADWLAEAFKALSHPVRLQMLDLIAQGDGQVCGCDIERHFNLTQPTISHHLKVLRDAGLILSEARGVWMLHRVHTERLIGLTSLLSQFQGELVKE